ncbi:hypothetical protein CR155_06055 [Pollutimonas nitritireducens]|uniref:Uncharacterized protein n=1 Tax=Pollutimonas nitritireducens TaxID=2045209 RepID=A0A2N4UJ13_9BURK|nr:hypothetical protein [Pollutimonas nitritireducens]PLC55013.1 hypothetical protein CR155_06055 [Pollutimonas nitritireducens]
MNSPQIVNGIGIYRTQGGRLAFITEITAGGESGEVSCLGYVLVFDQRAVATEWHRWSLSGQCNSGNDLELHLVERV